MKVDTESKQEESKNETIIDDSLSHQKDEDKKNKIVSHVWLEKLKTEASLFTSLRNRVTYWIKAYKVQCHRWQVSPEKAVDLSPSFIQHLKEEIEGTD